MCYLLRLYKLLFGGGVLKWLRPHVPHKQMFVCVFVYAYGICRYEHRPYHCIHINVSHTIYIIVDIGRKHEIGRKT